MKKNKKNAWIKELNLTLPTGWGKLTSEQVMRVAYYLSQRIAEPEYLVRLGIEFAGLKPRGTREFDGEIRYLYYHRNHGNLLLTAEQVATIAYAMKWTTKDPEPMAAPLLDGYRTPDSRLYGVMFEQFITADTAYGAYARTQDTLALRTFVVSLYSRREFNPDRLPQEAARIARLPEYQMQAVLLWFSGAKRFLQKKYPYVFSTDESGSGSVTPGDELLLGLLSSLNEGRIADNGKIRQVDVHEVLYELNLKIKNSKKRITGCSTPIGI